MFEHGRYDFYINGLGYRVFWDGTNLGRYPYSRTIEPASMDLTPTSPLTQQSGGPYDVSTLKWPWRMAFRNWIGGAGQNSYDDELAVPGRYKASHHIDVSSQGQFKLGPNIVTVEPPEGMVPTGLISEGAGSIWVMFKDEDGNYVPYYYKNGNWGTPPPFYVDPTSELWVRLTHNINWNVLDDLNWPSGEICYDIASNGERVVFAYESGLYYIDKDSSNDFVHSTIQSMVADTSLADCTHITYAGGILYAVQYTIANGLFCGWLDEAGAMHKLTPSAYHQVWSTTNVPDGQWEKTEWDLGPMAIVNSVGLTSLGAFTYWLVRAGDTCVLYKLTGMGEGSFEQVCSLPSGFIATSLCSYLGNIYIGGYHATQEPNVGVGTVYVVSGSAVNLFFNIGEKPDEDWRILALLPYGKFLYFLVNGTLSSGSMIMRYSFVNGGFSHVFNNPERAIQDTSYTGVSYTSTFNSFVWSSASLTAGSQVWDETVERIWDSSFGGSHDNIETGTPRPVYPSGAQVRELIVDGTLRFGAEPGYLLVTDTLTSSSTGGLTLNNSIGSTYQCRFMTAYEDTYTRNNMEIHDGTRKAVIGVYLMPAIVPHGIVMYEKEDGSWGSVYINTATNALCRILLQGRTASLYVNNSLMATWSCPTTTENKLVLQQWLFSEGTLLTDYTNAYISQLYADADGCFTPDIDGSTRVNYNLSALPDRSHYIAAVDGQVWCPLNSMNLYVGSYRNGYAMQGELVTSASAFHMQSVDKTFTKVRIQLAEPLITNQYVTGALIVDGSITNVKRWGETDGANLEMDAYTDPVTHLGGNIMGKTAQLKIILESYPDVNGLLDDSPIVTGATIEFTPPLLDNYELLLDCREDTCGEDHLPKELIDNLLLATSTGQMINCWSELDGDFKGHIDSSQLLVSAGSDRSRSPYEGIYSVKLYKVT